MAYSLLAISVNGSSNSRFPGDRSASMFGAGPIRCASITGHHTKSEFRLIGCCRLHWPMWTATRKIGAALCRCSTAPPRRSRHSTGTGGRSGSCLGQGRIEQGVEPDEIGVFVRSPRELRRARNAIKQAGVPAVELSDKIEITLGKLSIGTMYLAKGLEFRSVAVMACDDEIIPSQERIENVADDADLEVVYDSERHLLYVACTRARDHLLVTGVNPASEFLGDLME
jgi:UvrD-like helicase C-terminal domain